MIKKVFAAALALILFFPAAVLENAYAAEQLPGEFWGLNESYLAAQAAGDDDGIIAYGEQVIALLTSRPETNQAKEVLASRYYDVADAYDRKNNFVKAAYYYEKYIPYGEYMSWRDGVKIAGYKVDQYIPAVTVYTDAVQPQRCFGSRNEPELGVLYGQVSEHTQPDDSMILLYIDYGNMLTEWDYGILEQAKQRGTAVEIAWNMQEEGDALAKVPDQKQYITDFLNELKKYSEVPIYLRIGAEMNIWDVKADPRQFREAFRFIADLVHEHTKHVATVWSVSHASEWDTNMEDFYPGDEYVDWIGISAYMIRHFQGMEWPVEQRFSEVSFGSGDAADPIMIVKETLDKFGGRKPVMLAECGSAHTTTSLGMDNTDWAVTNLQRMYWFVPMVYPQVKLIAYFNTYVPPETNDYALTHNAALEQTYQELVRAPHFIQKQYGDKAERTYQPITGGMVLPKTNVPLYTYPHVFGDSKPAVRYYMDGKLVAERTEIPYQLNLDLSGYELGGHVLRSEAVSGGRVAAVQEYAIQITEDISVMVDGRELAGDVVPVMEQERVLVPMRTIFEALGAEVSWDDSSKTAKAQKGWTDVEITIDQAVMKKDGREIALDVPVHMINDRTMVPVRAVSEALGAEVEWNQEERIVSVWQRSENGLSKGLYAIRLWLTQLVKKNG